MSENRIHLVVSSLLAGAVGLLGGCSSQSEEGLQQAAPVGVQIPVGENSGVKLLRNYQQLAGREQWDFLQGLNADRHRAFVLAWIAEECADLPAAGTRERAYVLSNWGDEMERWGKKLLADGRPLTATTILEMLKDDKGSDVWRDAYRVYLQVIFSQKEPRDAREIGLSEADIAILREHVGGLPF